MACRVKKTLDFSGRVLMMARLEQNFSAALLGIRLLWNPMEKIGFFGEGINGHTVVRHCRQHMF